MQGHATIAMFPADGDTLDVLMRNADTAMYESKAEGRATTRFFEPRMNTQLDARRALESRLRLALELNALSLYYQPLVSCGTGYSSLSYLQSFKFNRIKIDRAFVSNLENNPENASIVQAHACNVSSGVSQDGIAGRRWR